MHPFEVCISGATFPQLLADPVLHRLHVMIGARLNRLDRRGIG